MNWNWIWALSTWWLNYISGKYWLKPQMGVMYIVRFLFKYLYCNLFGLFVYFCWHRWHNKLVLMILVDSVIWVHIYTFPKRAIPWASFQTAYCIGLLNGLDYSRIKRSNDRVDAALITSMKNTFWPISTFRRCG